MAGGVKSDLSLTSVVYDPNALTLTGTGKAFAENQGTLGKILLNGVEPTGTYVWGDSTVVLTLLAALATGSYDAQLINGDGEASNTLAGEIVVASTTTTTAAPTTTTAGPTTTSEPVAVSTLRYMTLRIEKWFWKGF